jgi:DNA-binding FadR family transcriptional regulator
MTNNQLSALLLYLAEMGRMEKNRIPSIVELSKKLGIGTALIREQLEVAKMLGIVEVKPKLGIRRLNYSFAPAIYQSLSYAIALSPENFPKYSDLRVHLESIYWNEAVNCLTQQDHDELMEILSDAKNKLEGHPIQNPHQEHKRLHLKIFSRLNNPFVTGLLESYWDLYEMSGLAVYADYSYLKRVWFYHEKIVLAICEGNIQDAFTYLKDHVDLIVERPEKAGFSIFE